MEASEELQQAIQMTWEAIGSDCLDMAPEIDNEGALEMVLDADRMAMYGGSNEAVDEYRRLLEEFGFAGTIRVLSKQIQLV